jgi:N-acetylmuramoyl-L-alanine amidase
MSIKEITKCLTILIWLLPSINTNASVKDILNSHDIESLYCDVHSSRLQTHISHLEFIEHRKDNKNIVVIDAGHGGHDPGAMGKNSKEKEIALKIALKIGQQLRAIDPSLIIIYTRTKDVFIPLHKRISLANKEKADLFISIHCNYVDNPHVCGTETFVMGLHRAEENLNVAKRENSAVLLENEYETNYEGYDPNSPIGHILLSMFQNIYLDNSIDLASQVELALEKRKRTKSRGVKQAGFVVLRQATMPSVLIETGFLSNPKEEKYLMSQKGQTEMAQSISKGITAYFSTQPIFVNSKNKRTKAKAKKKNFIVQIGAFSKPIHKDLSNNLLVHGTLITHEVNGLYKYAIGYYELKNEAYKACEELKSNGFVDAFVKSNGPKTSE